MFKPWIVWFSAMIVSVGCGVSAFGADAASDSPAKETKAQRDARMAWFHAAKFGMFIHWGVYSVPAGEWQGKKDYGEWFLEQTKMPVSQYEKFRDQFNPVKFDAKQWVAIAKDAGMKYLVITSKHHDGFAMFDTKLTDWGIMSTPFHRDPMKELAAACKQAGIKFCFYHSIMDWHHPDYTPRRPWNDVAKAHGDPDFDRYVQYMKGQLKELTTELRPAGHPLVRRRVGEHLDPRARQGPLRLCSRFAAGHHRQQPRGQESGRDARHEQGRRDCRRLRHARAGNSRRRSARRRLGIVHDDEQPLGLQQDTTKLEIVDGDDPHVDRHRQQRRQLLAERRPDVRGPDSRTQRRAAARDGQVD